MESVAAFVFDPVTSGALLGALSLILLGAAIHKFTEPNQFLSALSAYRLVPVPLLNAVARTIPIAEVALGVLILLPATRSVALAAVALLLAAYGAGVGVNLLRGRSYIDCGCGGDAQQLSRSLVIRNGVLCAIALVLMGANVERTLNWLDGVALVLGVLALFATYLLANELLRQASRMSRAERSKDSWSSL